MWFDNVKKEEAELEGLHLEGYESVKRSINKILDRIKNLRTMLHNNWDAPELKRNMESALTNLQYDVDSLLELLNVADNLKFEDQMRGKE